MTVRLIGIGGAGCIVVESMPPERIPGASSMLVDADWQWLDLARCRTKLRLGAGMGRPPRADGAFWGQQARESQADIEHALRGARAALLVCGLGGALGSGAAPVVAEIARGLGAQVLCIATLPFAFEGEVRMAAARRALDALGGSADRILVYANERSRVSAGAPHDLSDAMNRANDELRNAIQCLIHHVHESERMDTSSERMLQLLQDAGCKSFVRQG